MDLGPAPADDPSCSKVAALTDVSHVDYGKSVLTDCIRFYAEVAVQLHDSAAAAAYDFGDVCDALANGGGRTKAASDDLHDRCAVAIAALQDPQGPYRIEMRSFTIVETSPSVCGPAPALTCGACPLPCDPTISAPARAFCTPATARIVPATEDPSAAGTVALGALDFALAHSYALTQDHAQDLRVAVVATLRSIPVVLTDMRNDQRGATCTARAEALISDANDQYAAVLREVSAVYEAIRIAPIAK